jgi:hypothetical protein
MAKLQTTQNTPVIPFTGDTSHNTEPTTANNPSMQLPTTGMGRAKDVMPLHDKAYGNFSRFLEV